VAVDDGAFEVLAVEDVVDVTGDAVVAHADVVEEVDASFVGAADVATGPVVGLSAGAEFDIAAQREEDRLGIEY
jgi:hypothetical protein